MSGRLDVLGTFLDDLRPGSAPPSEDLTGAPNNLAEWQNLAGAFQALRAANKDALHEAPSLQALPDRFNFGGPVDLEGADYVKYYYQNRNLNPRLPPPSLLPRPTDPKPENPSQAEMDATHAAALSMLLGVQQQIQEPGGGAPLDAFRNMRSHLGLSGSFSGAAPGFGTQRFASSCAVLGDAGSRQHSFTSGTGHPSWAMAPGSGNLGRSDLANNSTSQAQHLDGLMQAFSPRTSFSNNSVFSAHVTAPPGSLMSNMGLSNDHDLGGSGGGLLVDPLFGGVPSAGLSPRSSVTSMQAMVNDPIAAAAGSPARNSPMSQSFTLGSAKDGKVPLLSNSGRCRQPSKLRIGSTSEFLQGVDINPGTPPGRTNHGHPDGTVPGLGSSNLAPNNGGGDLNTAESSVQQPGSLSESAAAAVLAAAAASTSPTQQQQLQQMYLAISGYGVPMAYGPPAYGGYVGQQASQQQYAQVQAQAYQAQAYGLDMGMLGLGGPSMDMGMQAGNLNMPRMQQGMPYAGGMPGAGFPPVSPAEYAAYYQRYMENQAVMAAAMGMQSGMGMDGFGLGRNGLGAPQDNIMMPDNGAPMGHHGRHRSFGGGGTLPPTQFDRARNNGYVRSSGEVHLAPGIPLGMGRSESGADGILASHMERLHMSSSGGMGVNSRRNSRREGDGSLASRASALLEEFKANKARRYELSDIMGHMYEFSLDQHGSRFIQQKLEVSTPEELGAALAEVTPKVTTLMTDVFGNYVVQKFFEHGSQAQRLKLAESLKGQVLQLSLQMYGCRVVQKALEVLPPDAQCTLLAELDGNVMRCVRDQNGNHVIQKVIECVPTARITALLDNFLSCVVQLSSHPFGCRVMQRILEHCKDEQRRAVVMEEILRSAHPLAQDQYGNYVIQHVLEHGTPAEKHTVVGSLSPHVVTLSMHKFASNVVEKCLTHCTPAERDAIVKLILGPDPAGAAAAAAAATAAATGHSSGGSRNGSLPGSYSLGGVDAHGPDSLMEAEMGQEDALQQMMKDQFGNYVVQRVLEVCDDAQRDNLLQRVRAQLHLLKKFTYGKHIVARVEKLLSAGTKIQTHLRARPLPHDTAPLAVLALRTHGTASPASGSALSRSLSPENSMGPTGAAADPGSTGGAPAAPADVSPAAAMSGTGAAVAEEPAGSTPQEGGNGPLADAPAS